MDRNERIYNKILKKNSSRAGIDYKQFKKDLQLKMIKDDEFAVFYHIKYNSDDKIEKQMISERLKAGRKQLLKKKDCLDSRKVLGLAFGGVLGLMLAGVAFTIAGLLTHEAYSIGLSAAGTGLFSASLVAGFGNSAVGKSVEYKLYKNEKLSKLLEDSDQNPSLDEDQIER